MPGDKEVRVKIKALDRISAVLDKVTKKFPKLTTEVKKTSRVFAILQAKTKHIRKTMNKIGSSMKRVGRSVTIGATLPLALLGIQSTKTFASYQQGLRGVEKTTGISRDKVGELGKRFRQLSTEIPVTTKEMLELAQAGGQLGIKGAAELEKFTVTMSKLSRASDVAGEDGAKAIARILNVTDEGIMTVDRFSAALVDLGNSAAASESEILQVATRVAGQIGQFDASSAKVLGISTALKSLGKNAEAGGTVIGRAFQGIDQAIKNKGSSAFKGLSKLTGIAGDDLEEAFAKDSVAVFQKFVEGLAAMKAANMNTTEAMKVFNLEGARVNDVMGTLIKKPQVLAESIKMATDAYAKNIALQEEFETQTDSFGSAMTLVSNSFTDLTTLIGEDLAPMVQFLGEKFKSVLDVLRESPALRMTAIVLASIVAVMGPLLIAVGTFLTMLPFIITGMTTLSTVSLPITGTFLLIAAAVIIVIGVIARLIDRWDKMTSAFSSGKGFFNSVGRFFKAFAVDVDDSVSSLERAAKIKANPFPGRNKIQQDEENETGNVKTEEGDEPKQGETGVFKFGKQLGALKAMNKIGAKNNTNTNNARVDINIKDTGGNADVRGKADDLDLFSLNNGFAGAAQ